jgi:hypothetical protein
VTDRELEDLFEAESRAVMQGAQLPEAGQIWWKAAIRARAESTDAAARPMIWLQALAGAAAAGLALGAGTSVWPRLSGVLRQLDPAAPSSVLAAVPLPLVAAIGLAIVAAPIAFYLAVPRD